MKKSSSLITGFIFIFIGTYISLKFEENLEKIIYLINSGWVFSSITLRVLICLSFARGVQLIVKNFKPNWNVILIFSIGFIMGFGVSFISPIYETDYGDLSKSDMNVDVKNLSNLTKNEFQFPYQASIITFFTSDCPHCKAASKKLGFVQSIGNTPPIFSFFPGNKEDTERFLNENNGKNFLYYLVENTEEFVNITQGTFPTIFLLDADGNTIKCWVGDQVNYTALDFISKIK